MSDMKMEVLSVAENGYDSDTFSASQKNRKYDVICRRGVATGHVCITKEVRFSLDINQTLLVREFEDTKLKNTISLSELDIEGMIAYLNEVKTFISEEKMIKKLLGKNF